MPTDQRILAINLLLVVAIYIFAGIIPIEGGAMAIGALGSVLQFVVNLVLAVTSLIGYVFQPDGEKKTKSLSLSGTFFISAILVVFLSFPICLVLGTIRF